MKATQTYMPVAVSAVATLLIIVALLVGFQKAHADVTTFQQSTPGDFKTYTFFATSTAQTVFSTTTSATSTNITTWTNSSGVIDKGYFVIAGSRRVTWYFKRTGALGNQGSTEYRVQVANKENPSESDWYYYNKLVQNLATSTTPTTLSSIVVTQATTTVIASMDLPDTFYAVRCIATETTDGEHSCSASASY